MISLAELADVLIPKGHTEAKTRIYSAETGIYYGKYE